MKKVIFPILSVVVLTLLLGGCTAKSKQHAQEQPKPKTEAAAINIIQSTPPNMLNQLKAKEIDGFIVWEPFDTVAVESGAAKYLFKSPQIWKDHPCCVVALSENYKDNKTVEAFTWAHLKATKFINDPNNKEKVIKYAADFTGRDTATISQALHNISYTEYPAKNQFEYFYNYLGQGKLLTKSVKDIGYSNTNRFFSGFLQTSVYKTVSDNLNKNPNWVPAPVSSNTKLRLGYINNDMHQLARYIAEKEGYLAVVGLIPGKRYETKGYENGVAIMQAFKSKDIDMAYLGGAPAILKRINDNIPVKAVAGANDEGSALVVRTDSGINSISDLKGKTIAVPGIGTVQYTLLEKAIKDKGLRLVVK